MSRRKWSWTKLQLERADHVTKVTEELRQYWPLTLRQVYYRLVTRPHTSMIYDRKKGCGFTRHRLPNNKSSYNTLSLLLKWMRIEEKLPWDVIEDRTRVITDKRGFTNLNHFINQEMDDFLTEYTRCLIQNQDKYIEVWTEKDALLRVFEEVVWPYCIRAVICRGYDSVTFEADFYLRAEKALSLGKTPVVLYFGDLDPSGVDMFEAAIKTLEDEMDLCGVEWKRIGLNPSHIDKYSLVNSVDAAKETDTRYKKYMKKYGKIAVELDALHPAILKEMIREAVEAEIDMVLYEKQLTEENCDENDLSVLRPKIMDAIYNVLP